MTTLSLELRMRHDFPVYFLNKASENKYWMNINVLHPIFKEID
jgi:hypothetical protein